MYVTRPCPKHLDARNTKKGAFIAHETIAFALLASGISRAASPSLPILLRPAAKPACPYRRHAPHPATEPPPRRSIGEMSVAENKSKYMKATVLPR